MSDAPEHEHGTADVEALLRELDAADREIVQPPPAVWEGIRDALTHEHGSPATPVVDRRSGIGARFLAVAAAVAAIAVGAAVVVAVVRSDDAVVTSARLVHDADRFDPLGADAVAVAEVIDRDDGLAIRLVDATLPDPSADDLELWLIATDAAGVIVDVRSVATVDPNRPGTYAVPAGVELGEYSVVDISVEPRDGDAAHSGRSILRGTLDV